MGRPLGNRIERKTATCAKCCERTRHATIKPGNARRLNVGAEGGTRAESDRLSSQCPDELIRLGELAGEFRREVL
jgi:hypothetical protein